MSFGGAYEFAIACEGAEWDNYLHIYGRPPRQNSLFTGVVRVGSTFSLDETHANSYTPVVVVHGHVWCMVCKVFASGVCVCPTLLCNFLS